MFLHVNCVYLLVNCKHLLHNRILLNVKSNSCKKLQLEKVLWDKPLIRLRAQVQLKNGQSIKQLRWLFFFVSFSLRYSVSLKISERITKKFNENEIVIFANDRYRTKLDETISPNLSGISYIPFIFKTNQNAAVTMARMTSALRCQAFLESVS